MVSKTRDRLIEVARQLFVNKGVENTTMNDIATASKKGRRTIYTYFKNKKEIFDAVVETESNDIILQLKEIVDSDMNLIEKLELYLTRRFEVIPTVQKSRKSYDRYRFLFSRDARKVEKIYEMARKKEQDVFVSLLNQGVQAGIFDAAQAKRLPSLMSIVFITSDHVKMNSISIFDNNITDVCDNIIDFVTNGVIIK